MNIYPSEHATLKNTRLSKQQIEGMLRCYAQQITPREAAKKCKVSSNTIYLHYSRIRWRLIITRYYENIAESPEASGLSPLLKSTIKKRRGIRKENFLPHSAELIDWLEEWPPQLVLKHIKKIIELTGPLDLKPELNDTEIDKLRAYIRYARIELIYNRRQSVRNPDIAEREKTERAKEALNQAWRNYRKFCKHLERSAEKPYVTPRRRKRVLMPK